MRTFEDPDYSSPRDALMYAPQEVVLLLDLGRCLEARDFASHRIDTSKNFLDRTVLPGRVPTLQDDEHSVPRIRIQNCLQLLETLALVLRGFVEIVAVRDAVRARSVVVAKLHLAWVAYRFELHGMSPASFARCTACVRRRAASLSNTRAA